MLSWRVYSHSKCYNGGCTLYCIISCKQSGRCRVTWVSNLENQAGWIAWLQIIHRQVITCMDLQALTHEGQQVQQPLHCHTAEPCSIAAPAHTLPPVQPMHVSAIAAESKQCQAVSHDAPWLLCNQAVLLGYVVSRVVTIGATQHDTSCCQCLYTHALLS